MFLSLFRADAGDATDRSPSSDFWFKPIWDLAAALGLPVTSNRAMMNPTVWACVNVLAKSFAVMPFVLYQPKEGGGRTKLRKHWLFRLFAKAPNRFQTPFEFRLMLMGHLALRGNAYCQIAENRKGEITELLPLHPDRMTIEMLDNGSYRYRYQDERGRTLYYTRNEIWHLRGLSSDGIMGLSPIEYAREAIGEGLAMQSYASRFFANDAKPGGGWIEVPGSFATQAQKREFRESWQEMQGGANRGKVAVLERGMKFHEIGLNNRDSQFVEARKDKVPELCRIFGVQPHKIGDLTRSTNNNIEHQSIEFWTDTMLPLAELWESSIEFFLLGPDSDLEPEFDMSRMMRGDGASRTAYYQGGIQSGWLMRNEAREAEGYDPIDGLSEPLQPLNMGNAGGNPDQPPPRPVKQQGSPVDDEDEDASAARLDALLHSNASRLARRFAKDGAPDAALIADALAVSPACAEWWAGVLGTMKDPTEAAVRRCLMACARDKETA